MAKMYTVKKEINGKTYTAQFNGISAALKAVDNSYIDGTTNMSIEKISKYLFENVIVDPKMQINDFGADNIGMEETTTINGNTYTARFDGMLNAVRAVDNSYKDGSDQISVENLANYLFENVIVEPKGLTPDDFETMEEFNKVVSFAREVMQGGKMWDEYNKVVAFAQGVMQGNFREEKEQRTTKKTSER